MKNKRELDVLEILDEVLPLLHGKERITIPQFTKVRDWFDGLPKTAPRTLRQK